jgi:hypothetical protein
MIGLGLGMKRKMRSVGNTGLELDEILLDCLRTRFANEIVRVESWLVQKSAQNPIFRQLLYRFLRLSLETIVVSSNFKRIFLFYRALLDLSQQ